MKRIFKYIFLAAVVVNTSACKKYLDINQNPNSLTKATPALILPQAIVGAASIHNSYNISLADFSGARANAGGFGGFGSVVTYDITSGDYTGLFTTVYDNVNDFQYVIDNTLENKDLAYSTSIARIMKSAMFERLVNQYNDVPYSEAFTGQKNFTPKYDKAVDIYKDLIAQLTLAIADIDAAKTVNTTNAIPATADPMFKGNMALWQKYANTLKLRMLIKMAGVADLKAYATDEMNKINKTIGFLTADALVNPGYEKANRPNPVYSSLGFASDGTNVSTSRIPTKWMFSFYNGGKLSDDFRGKVIYRSYPSTPVNQMGDESASVPAALSAGSAWNTGTNNTNVLGVAKGPTQATPVMLAAESYFLQAEAVVRGYMAGDAASLFNNGIKESFKYLYKDVNGTVDATKNVDTDFAAYLAANSDKALAVYTLNTTDETKLEAIITQKYIALNMVANDEAFNEFRRTMYPKITNGSQSATATFASLKSISTHVDKLPTRVLYPQVEFNLNGANVPKDINKFSSKIFWDIN